MARTSSPAPRTLLSLEQFAALEVWIEGQVTMRLAENSAGPGRAERITAAYQSRMRAMRLLTGAEPPATDPVVEGDDDAAW